ncbi:MAG: hypothetical protein IPO70_09045 [Bacteroidetes bacterium]|nr:hypothetical protein [Bacteroidota bacterium]
MPIPRPIIGLGKLIFSVVAASACLVVEVVSAFGHKQYIRLIAEYSEVEFFYSSLLALLV